MRRVVLASVLALVVGAALWHLLQYDPGYILIVAGGKTIEMRFAFAVILLLVGVPLLIWLWRLLWRASSALRGGWNFAANRRALRAELRSQRGLLHFIEGNWQDARRNLLKAAKHMPRPLVHYLAAARSAYELGQGEQARELLAKAETLAPHDDLAVVLSRARMQLAEKNYEACLATLHRAKTQAPANPVVLDLLRRVYLALTDWAAMEVLLPELRSAKVLDPVEFEQLEQQVYLALLNQAGKPIRGQGQDETAVLALSDIWRRVPKPLKQQPLLLATYCRWMILAQQHEPVEHLLRQALKQQWSPALVELYGLTQPAGRQAQLQTAQRWLQDHPDEAILHLTLARLCLRNELWGQAREHLQQSLTLQPAPATYAELARLLASLGEHPLSAQYYQQGLLLATNGLPSLPMPTR